MAAFANLSSEERVGISAAVIVHVALAAGLAWQATRETPALDPPERIAVSLVGEVSWETTSPDPSAEPAAAAASPETAQASPDVVEQLVSQPVERPVATQPRRTREQPVTRNTPAPAPTATATQPPRRDFGDALNLGGVSDGRADSGTPGDRPGATQQRSIDSEIIRQLKPHWIPPPSGVEVERLVTVVRFRLNRDGSLRGRPEIIATSGITNANRAQVSLHQEQAVRAVRLAAPFNLPERFYSGWSVVTSNFDNRLAQ